MHERLVMLISSPCNNDVPIVGRAKFAFADGGRCEADAKFAQAINCDQSRQTWEAGPVFIIM